MYGGQSPESEYGGVQTPEFQGVTACGCIEMHHMSVPYTVGSRSSSDLAATSTAVSTKHYVEIDANSTHFANASCLSELDGPKTTQN